MTEDIKKKRELVQDGIYNIIKENCQSASGWVGNKAYTMELIMKYLHEHDCVLKVEGKLPDIRFNPSAIKVYDRNGKPISHADAAKYTQQDMLKAGYGAFEPLIDESTGR